MDKDLMDYIESLDSVEYAEQVLELDVQLDNEEEDEDGNN